MSDYQLTCFAQSGNAYKCALMLQLNAADWEADFVDFFNGATRTPDYRALNEMGEVPVLTHGAVRLSQSGVILDYLAEAFGTFGPASDEERREILRWTLWDNHKLTGTIASLRFMMKFLPHEKRDPGVIDWLRRRAKGALELLDHRLFAHEWVAVPGRATTADLSCAGYLFYDHEFGFELDAFPNIERWRKAIAALPGWRHPYDLMPGHPLPAPS
ncbi:MAG: glutathione S-transferase [Amaricoccus sp.]